MEILKNALCLIMVVLLSSTILAQDAKVAGRCVTCHKEKSPGLYMQWRESAHGQSSVTCIDCHGAERSDADAFMHEGAYIATLVTPKDCGVCHPQETKEVDESYHAAAGLILESNDAYLAHVAGGQPAALNGCNMCHGSKIIIDEDSPNKLSKLTWPNSGIGRLNPDGSKGACTACHTRHSFSKAQARQPEACSKCHLGPDHPQKEVYEESKHGNAYYTHDREVMNFKSEKWVVGVDYYEAPTCATCHMGATRKQKATHDVGTRLKWSLRPPVSKKKDNAELKRANMKDVCLACHGDRFAEGQFYQFDALVNLYDNKFAKPAGEIMKLVRDSKLLENPASFSNEIEWIYWELWHHEGRRARHGAAMMGPDYTWWHGIYDVIHNFYFEFLPAAKHFNNPTVNTYIDNLLTNDKMHQWLSQNTEKLKDGIKTGEHQEIYKHLFEE